MAPSDNIDQQQLYRLLSEMIGVMEKLAKNTTVTPGTINDLRVRLGQTGIEKNAPNA
jgi:hypothetical protein